VLPDFLLFYVLIGAVLAGRSKPTWGKGVPWVAGVSAILCFAYMGNISHYNYDCAGIWSGRQTRDEYLMSPVKMTPYFDTAQNISNHVPPRACLLVVGDARGLYYDRPFLTNSVFDEQTLAKFAREAQDAGGIARSLQKLGVDYLVVNGNEGVRVAASYHHYDLTSEQWKILDDFVQRDLDMVYLQGLQAVYKVRREPRIDNPQPETTDFLMLFSNPATQFLTDWQRHRWAEARRDMDEVLKLYPFSAYWKGQKAELDKVLKKT
jgi:hypothetical protein